MTAFLPQFVPIRHIDDTSDLRDQIRDLNDALTQANQDNARLNAALDEVLNAKQFPMPNERLSDVVRMRYGREANQWRHNHDERKRERDFEIAAHDGTKAKLASALDQLDGLTREVMTLRDSASEVTKQRCLQILRDVMATMSRETGDPGQERVRNGARAFLAECGVVSPEHEGHRVAFMRWEEGKR